MQKRFQFPRPFGWQAHAIEVFCGSVGAQDGVPWRAMACHGVPWRAGALAQLLQPSPSRHPGISTSAVDFDVSPGVVPGSFEWVQGIAHLADAFSTYSM